MAMLMTRTQVSLADSTFASPSKPIGPLYTVGEADRLGRDHGWTMAADRNAFRCVVASPAPLRVLCLRPIEWLRMRGALVIAAGAAASR